MKKYILLFIIISFVTSSCKDEVIAKPKNLIERNKMVDIIYDLSILEAAKSQTSGVQNYPRATKFIKDKYKIDSVTFAQSTQYYASDMKAYKKMYDEVKERLNTKNTKLNGGKIIKETTEDGVVK